MRNALHAYFPSHSQLLKKNVELEGEDSCPGRLSWRAGLKDGAPANVPGTRWKKGGSPNTMLFKAVLCQGQTKCAKPSQGEKKVLILLDKAMQQQFKMWQRILAGMKKKENKRKRSFNKHVIKELKLAFQNKVFLVYIFLKNLTVTQMFNRRDLPRKLLEPVK